MITVAIIGILASIAIPKYLNHTYRARQVEAITVLNVAKNQQFTHLALHDCFAATEVMPLGVPGPVPRVWNSISSGPALPCSGAPRTFLDVGIVPLQSLVYFTYQCSARQASLGFGTDEFTCSARGDLDGDGNEAEILYCSDLGGTGSGLPSPGPSGAGCPFPFGPVRVSPAIF